MPEVEKQPDIAEQLDIANEQTTDFPSSEGAGLALAWLFWTNRRRIGQFVLAGLLIGILVALLTPNRYESTTRIMPPDTTSSTSMAATMMAAANSAGVQQVADTMPFKSTGALFLGILRSRTVQQRLVDRFDLKKVYRTKLDTDARKKLDDYTTISEDRRAGIITLTVSDRDPQRAAALARGYIEELNSVVVNQNTSSAHRERVFLEERLKLVESDLTAAGKALSEFSSRYGVVDVGQQAKSTIEVAAQLQGRLLAAESELSSLQQVYSDSNVRVLAAKASVAKLRSELQTMATPDGDVVQSAALSPPLRKLPPLALTYAELYRRAKLQEALYETLTKQYELAQVQEAKEVPRVQVLDLGDVPERKSEPKRTITVLVSMSLLFLLGLFWVWLRASWQALPADDSSKRFGCEVWSKLSPSAMFWTNKLSRKSRNL